MTTIYSITFVFLSSSISSGVIVGISIALFIAGCIYMGIFRRKEVNEASFVPTGTEDFSTQPGNGLGSAFNKNIEALSLAGGASPGLTGITVDKSVEFCYEELAKATNDFSLDNKIGHGGFGTILYAELRGEKAAIKKMDMQASKEFLAELKGLVALPKLKEDIKKLIVPRLIDNYSIDSVCKMTQLVRACTQENLQLRPSMRSIVVALMTISSWIGMLAISMKTKL